MLSAVFMISLQRPVKNVAVLHKCRKRDQCFFFVSISYEDDLSPVISANGHVCAEVTDCSLAGKATMILSFPFMCPVVGDCCTLPHPVQNFKRKAELPKR